MDGLDKYFLTHRLPLALDAVKAGFTVTVAAMESNYAGKIQEAGFEFIPLPISRRGTALINELRGVNFLRQLYLSQKPDIIHQITLKPVLYGSLAARLAGNIPVLNSVTGLGVVFADKHRIGARMMVKTLAGIALRHPHSRTIFQNPDDQAEFIKMGLIPKERAILLRGSGVDCNRFHSNPEPTGSPIVMLATRMLWTKGIQTFVDVARHFRDKDEQVQFVLVGAPDFEDKSAVPVSQLEAWAEEGIIEWWGYRENMPEVLAQASIILFPGTYREGVPKVLLEAAASARPIIATDMPGCREIVRNGTNGLLIPPEDHVALIEAVQKLLNSPDLRSQLGHAGRKIAVQEFSVGIVVEKTLQLYQELLGAVITQLR